MALYPHYIKSVLRGEEPQKYKLFPNSDGTIDVTNRPNWRYATDLNFSGQYYLDHPRRSIAADVVVQALDAGEDVHTDSEAYAIALKKFTSFHKWFGRYGSTSVIKIVGSDRLEPLLEHLSELFGVRDLPRLIKQLDLLIMEYAELPSPISTIVLCYLFLSAWLRHASRHENLRRKFSRGLATRRSR